MKRTANDPETDFYDAVVCELRQPLATINGSVQRAKRLLRTDPALADEALEQVSAQIARVNLMLIEIRDRARDAAHVEGLFKR
jgi:signal transduction histidine kinase